MHCALEMLVLETEIDLMSKPDSGEEFPSIALDSSNSVIKSDAWRCIQLI